MYQRPGISDIQHTVCKSSGETVVIVLFADGTQIHMTPGQAWKNYGISV